jgi:hypothetical protein
MRTLKQILKENAAEVRFGIMGTIIASVTAGLIYTSASMPSDRALVRAHEIRQWQVTDLDGDNSPDVIYQAASKAFPLKPTYVFKEGYGPARSGPEGVDIKFASVREFKDLCNYRTNSLNDIARSEEDLVGYYNRL